MAEVSSISLLFWEMLALESLAGMRGGESFGEAALDSEMYWDFEAPGH